MIFTTIISSLFFVSLVLSFSFHNNIVKRDINDLTPECLNELSNSNDYLECYSTPIDISNYREICNVTATEKCQKILKDPFIAIPSCKNDTIAVEKLLTPLAIEYNIHLVPLICSYDSDGNLCPAAETVIKGLKINEEVISQTCESKKCGDGVKQYFEFILNNIRELENNGIVRSSTNKAETIYKKLLNRLNEKCKALNNNITQDENKYNNENINSNESKNNDEGEDNNEGKDNIENKNNDEVKDNNEGKDNIENKNNDEGNDNNEDKNNNENKDNDDGKDVCENKHSSDADIIKVTYLLSILITITLINLL